MLQELYKVHSDEQQRSTASKSQKLGPKATCQDPISNLIAAKLTAVSMLRSRLPTFSRWDPAEAPFCSIHTRVSGCLTSKRIAGDTQTAAEAAYKTIELHTYEQARKQMQKRYDSLLRECVRVCSQPSLTFTQEVNRSGNIVVPTATLWACSEDVSPRVETALLCLRRTSRAAI